MLTVTFEIMRGFACPRQKLKKLIKAVCGRFGFADAAVCIVIVGNNQIRLLNEKFLHRKTSTDCLSFDLSESPKGHRQFELVINGQKAKSEAAKRGHSFEAELALYVTHGLLHNLGCDDHSPAQAQRMHRLEDEILRQQGFGIVYEKTTVQHRVKC
jgi:probable rRNA maturation factor